MAAGGDAIARLTTGVSRSSVGRFRASWCEIEIVQAKKDFVRAEWSQVVEPLRIRVEPPCPAHAAGCGGCPWQHVDPGAQLELKTAVVIEALKRTGRARIPLVDVGGSVPAWAYRTTLRLAAGRGGRLGLRGRSSHEVVELDGCPVSHPLLQELLESIRVVGEGEVSLRVGAATGERSAWVADGDVRASRRSTPTSACGADAAVHEVVAGKRLRVSAASFFQSGPAAAEMLVPRFATRARTWASWGPSSTPTVASGCSPPPSRRDRRRVIESSASACADAAVNLAGRRARIVHSPVERWRRTAPTS